MWPFFSYGAIVDLDVLILKNQLTEPALPHDLDSTRVLQGALSHVQTEYVTAVPGFPPRVLNLATEFEWKQNDEEEEEE